MENYSLKMGKYILKNEYFNLINVVNEEIYALHFLITEKNLKLNLICNADSIVINADKQLVRQAFLNLLTNAVKYSPNSNEVRIEITKAKGCVVICVANSLNSGSKKTTGFGHEIIKDAMEKLGGKIYNARDKNKICFYMELKLN